MALNPGLSAADLKKALDHARCPMCQTKLRIKDGLEWAGCVCCGVEYARSSDEREVYSRYEPKGHPHCSHYT